MSSFTFAPSPPPPPDDGKDDDDDEEAAALPVDQESRQHSSQSILPAFLHPSVVLPSVRKAGRESGWRRQKGVLTAADSFGRVSSPSKIVCAL